MQSSIHWAQFLVLVSLSSLVFAQEPPVRQNPQELLPLRGVAQEPPNFPKTTVFYLKHVSASEVAKVIEALYSDLDKTAQIKITPDERKNALYISAPATVRNQIEALLQVLDEKPEKRQTVKPLESNEVKVFSLKNADSQEVVNVVSALFGNNVDVTADRRSNSLLVVGSKEELAMVEAVLLRLDESQKRQADLLRIYPLRRLSTEKAAEIIGDLGIRANVAIDADQKRLILRGDETAHQMLAELLKTIDVADSKPPMQRMQLRIVWLVDEKLGGNIASTPPANLEKVIKVLDEKLGVKNLKTAAQLLVTVDPGDEGSQFTARGTTKFAEDISIELEAEGVLRQAGPNPTIELSIHAEEQARGVDSQRPTARQQLTSLTTKVAAPRGHSIVLGMTPIKSAASVFVLQVLPNEEPASDSK